MRRSADSLYMLGSGSVALLCLQKIIQEYETCQDVSGGSVGSGPAPNPRIPARRSRYQMTNADSLEL